MVNVSMCDRCRGEGTIIQDPCVECRGQGVVRVTRTLRVSIPAGIDDNSQIRLANEGEPGPKGGPAGNLYLLVHVQPHRYFHRQGNELLVELPINVAQAALGDELEIESLDGPVAIKVPAGTQNGRTLRIRGKGVPYLREQNRGDLLVRLKVSIPTDLTVEAARAVQEPGRDVRRQGHAPGEQGVLRQGQGPPRLGEPHPPTAARREHRLRCPIAGPRPDVPPRAREGRMWCCDA